MPASVDMPPWRNAPQLAGARSDLVAGDQCNKQVAKADVLSSAERQQRGNDRQGGPAMCRRISLTGFIPAGRRGAERRKAGPAQLDIRRWPGGVARESKPQGLTELPHLWVAQSGHQAAECIEQQQ